MERSFKKVLVVGAGTMGTGIAQWFASQGIQTDLCDLEKDVALKGCQRIGLSWDKLVRRGKFTESEVVLFKKNLMAIDLASVDLETDLVLEAIVEEREAKVSVFQALQSKIPAAIFASNTSSIPISSMQKDLEHKETFLGLHFFNPAPVMKLVEVIRGHWSSQKLCQDLQAWFSQRGKEAAICQDSPGFLVNRMARNFYGEAFRIAVPFGPEEICEHDKIMKEVGGFPMGPFELMDLIGIDVNFRVTESIWKDYFFEPRFAPHPQQRKMVERGRLGKKSGGGFYSYE